jgi:translation elongation factor EF-Ts
LTNKAKYHTKDKIKNLSELTGLSILKCKKALAEANSEFETAKEMLLLKTEK